MDCGFIKNIEHYADTSLPNSQLPNWTKPVENSYGLND